MTVERRTEGLHSKVLPILLLMNGILSLPQHLRLSAGLSIELDQVGWEVI